MKTFIIICSILLIMMSCSAKKATSETANTNAEKERAEEIIKEGYIQAAIEDKTTSGCGFVIKNITTEEYLLPNNLEDKYKQDGLKVCRQFCATCPGPVIHIPPPPRGRVRGLLVHGVSP